MTTAQRMQSRRIQLGLSADEVATAIGVSRATLYRWESGEIEKIPMSRTEDIARALRTSVSFLMGWDDDPGKEAGNVSRLPDLRSVPRLGQIACGTPILAEQNLDGYDTVPAWVKCDFSLLCRGDSMIGAGIRDGDVVFVRAQAEVESGQIAAVLVDGEFDSEAVLKRFFRVGDTVTLVSENPAFPPMVFTGPELSRIRVIGLATHHLSVIH